MHLQACLRQTHNRTYLLQQNRGHAYLKPNRLISKRNRLHAFNVMHAFFEISTNRATKFNSRNSKYSNSMTFQLTLIYENNLMQNKLLSLISTSVSACVAHRKLVVSLLKSVRHAVFNPNNTCSSCFLLVHNDGYLIPKWRPFQTLSFEK